MSLLARYRKQGGMLEIVKLIEDSAEPKRSTLLNTIRAEDAGFAADVEKNLYNFEKFKQLPEGTVAEVVGSIPPKFVAMALVGEGEPFVVLCEKCLGKVFSEYKQEKENFAAMPPTQAQIEAARRKFISEARKLEKAGRIKLPAVEGPAGEAPSANAAAGSVGGVSARASDLTLATMPSIGGFGLHPPPSDMTNSDLETYLKSKLS